MKLKKFKIDETWTETVAMHPNIILFCFVFFPFCLQFIKGLIIMYYFTYHWRILENWTSWTKEMVPYYTTYTAHSQYLFLFLNICFEICNRFVKSSISNWSNHFCWMLNGSSTMFTYTTLILWHISRSTWILIKFFSFFSHCISDTFHWIDFIGLLISCSAIIFSSKYIAKISWSVKVYFYCHCEIMYHLMSKNRKKRVSHMWLLLINWIFASNFIRLYLLTRFSNRAMDFCLLIT